MGVLENLPSIQENTTGQEEFGASPEIERTAWENLFVSMERSFHNIVDLGATSVRKLTTIALDDDDIRKQTGAGWVGRNAGRIALQAREASMDPTLKPETNPEMMDKFAELLGTTVPYTVAAIGGAAVGGAIGGPVGAGGMAAKIGAALTSFSIMREEAYRDAINTGADEDTANLEGNIVGGINSLLEMAQIGGILRQSKTGAVLMKSIALNAKNKAWTQVLKSGGQLSMGVVRNATEEAIQEALQGTTSEIVPKLLRGKEIEPGFLERRGVEAAGGALIGGLFSGIGSLANTAIEQGKSYIPTVPEIESQFDPTIEEQAAEEFELEEDVMTEETSDMPSEGDIEFDEEIQEGQQQSVARVKDAIIGGAEIEPTIDEIVDEETEVEAPKSDVEVAAEKLSDAIGGLNVTEIRKMTEAERTSERAVRVAKGEAAKQKAIREGGTAEDIRSAFLREQRGELPTTSFNKFDSEIISGQDWEVLRRELITSDKLRPYEQSNAVSAMNDLQNGIVPTPSEMKLLRVAIPQLDTQLKAISVAAAAKERGKLKGLILELTNFPTTTLASFDVSMVGRQGITTAFRYPKQWAKAVVDSYKAMFSQEWANMQALEFRTRKYYDLGRRAGLYESELDGDLSSTEAQFYSSWAKRIPILRVFTQASERAAVVGMNNLRASIFDKVAEQWEGQGRTEQDYVDLAKVINASTGRGNVKVGSKADQLLPFLNAAFFSPRYVASRFELMGGTVKSLSDMATGKATPAGKILAAEMATFMGAGLMAMLLAEILGAKVEKDPRSSDFGKVQIGRTRVDVWGGFQQPVRTMAQIITGSSKATKSGELYSRNRLEILGRFVQSKLSPAVGLGVEMMSGKDFLGDPLPEFKDHAELTQYALQKLTPLVIQDTVDAFKYGDKTVAKALTLPLAFHGIGVQTFETTAIDDLTQMRDHYATEVFGKEWDQLGPQAQDALREYKPQIKEHELISKFERRNATFDATRQREAGVRVEKSLPKEILREMESLNMSVGGLSRTITRNWRLNTKLYRKYQDDVSTVLNKTLPRIMGSPMWDRLPPAEKQKMLDWAIREAKSSVRKNIVMTANMKDIEDIRKGVEDE